MKVSIQQQPLNPKSPGVKSSFVIGLVLFPHKVVVVSRFMLVNPAFLAAQDTSDDQSNDLGLSELTSLAPYT